MRSHKYPDAKICKSVDRWDANFLYLYCSGQEMPCGKEYYVEESNPRDSRIISNLCDKVLTS